MQQLTDNTHNQPLKIKPLISYPAVAEPGKEYLMSLDLQLAAPLADWPYPQEEYEIRFQLNLHPYFSYRPLTQPNPTIILHRFGGTYGPAEFLITANPLEIPSGEITITLLNASGLPISHFELPCEITLAQEETPQKRVVIQHTAQNTAPQYLSDLRKQHNLTQQQLAEMLGVNTISVARWEQGSSTPRATTIAKLHNLFQTEIIWPPSTLHVATEYDINDFENMAASIGKFTDRDINTKNLRSLGWTQTIQNDSTSDRLQSNLHTKDHWLRLAPSLLVAVIHKQEPHETEEQAIPYLHHLAQILAIPFVYLINHEGTITELNFINTPHVETTIRSTLPSRQELEERWFKALQLLDQKAFEVLSYSFQASKKPRFYQEAAINQAVIATLQARRGIRKPRVLITMATGTGKTLVAFQILWKLKKAQEVRNVLFLADRAYLLDQAQYRAFEPFKDAIGRGSGPVKTTRDVIFGTYQWLTTIEGTQEKYKSYPQDYFDVIVIDECHRGSASENSQWRQVLEYFSPAVQIGLTATPLETKDVQTNSYFGESIYTYTLRQGIRDGYLAPYNVRRIFIGPRSEISNDDLQYVQPNDDLQYVQPVEDIDQSIVLETSKNLRRYTETIASHFAQYLQNTDIRAKSIVFCVDNNHAQQMKLALEEACASWTRPGDIVRIVDDEGAEGKRNLSNFCTPRERQPIIVTTSKLLTTGVDVPTCKNILLARGVGSLVEFKQIIGRGTRLFLPDKKNFTILDYAGAIKHFFDPNFDGEPQSVQSEIIIPQEQLSAAYTKTDNDEEYISENSHPYVSHNPNSPEHTVTPPNSSSSYNYQVHTQHTSSHEQLPTTLSGTFPPNTGTVVVENNDQKYVVLEDQLYILGPDLHIQRQDNYIDYIKKTLHDDIRTFENLQSIWTNDNQMKHLTTVFNEKGINLNKAAEINNQNEHDNFDILAFILFDYPPRTRAQRVAGLRQNHFKFLYQFAQNPLTDNTVRTILDKYVQGTAPNVSDVDLLKIPPISLWQATPAEINTAFRQTSNRSVRDVLQEMKRLLYSV